MRQKAFVLVIAFLLVCGVLFAVSAKETTDTGGAAVINDIGRLNPTRVAAVVTNQEIEGLQQALAHARENSLKVSIAGKRHSMGGHTLYPDAVVLDMTGFNRTLAVDPAAKTITVQSGATWKDVIESLNPYGLSVQLMQAYNVFTVGGSMSVNIHESDMDYAPLVETVDSFRLLLANGTIVNVSRTENPELFSLVIGGYGLLGIILDVTLNVTDDVIYEKQEYVWNYTSYPRLYNFVRDNRDIKLVFARLSIAKDDTFLRQVIVTAYRLTDKQTSHELVPPQKTWLKKFLFGLSRKYDWGKKFRWKLQKSVSDRFEPPVVSRNNLLNNDIGYLDYHSKKNTDILQEYFIPPENLPAFIDDLRAIVSEHDANLLSATLRYVPKNTESFLSYSRATVIGVVLYFNVGLSEQEQQEVTRWTRKLTDAALKHNGTYYLPYQLYASPEQLRSAYPSIDEFFALKRKYDPQELFVNKFYEKYARR
jgi:FAD/FMN-containing dehydrogenase